MKLIIDIEHRTCRLEISDTESYKAPFFDTWRDILTSHEEGVIDTIKVMGYHKDKKDLFTEVVTLGASKCKKLDISDNYLKSDAIAIVSILRTSTTIEEIDLANNSIKDSGTEVLTRLQLVINLKKLNISNNWVRHLDGHKVDELFDTHPSLVLDVSDNSSDFKIIGSTGEYGAEHLIM